MTSTKVCTQGIIRPKAMIPYQTGVSECVLGGEAQNVKKMHWAN